MKKILLLLVVLVSSVTFAQNNGITYQAVIYSTTGESVPGIKNSNAPLSNKTICLQFSIVDDNSSTEYQEKVTVTTDDFGMVNLVIGNGTQTGGYANSFNAIVWASSQKYLKVSVDQSGNCSSFELISDQLLNYVPYALAANSAASVTGVVGIANGGTNATTVVGAKTNLLLQNVDNTSDLNKPLSTASQTALNTKVDKVIGKDLSTEDFTTSEKTKLDAITGTNTGDQDLTSFATTTSVALKANTADVNTELATKVDKVTGKVLSSNDYTTVEKNKLAAITGTNTGDQDLSSFATTTSVALKANTTDVTSELATKVDKVTGKELSSNDYTTVEKTKLAAITGTNTGDQDLTSFATTTSVALKANTISPNFLGLPTAPTAASGTNTSQLATTAFVTNETTGKFVDITTNQTIAGNKTFSSDIVVNGIKVGNGGGSQSTVIGDTANGTLDNSTALGFMTLDGNSGTNNTAVGTNSMRNSGTTSMNTSVGVNSGTAVNTGNGNTYVGHNANVVNNSTISNATAIGADAIVTASNTIQLGAAGENGTTPISNVKTSGTLTAGAVTYPNAHGTTGQVLTTNGNGNLAWTDKNIGTGTQGYLTKWASTTTSGSSIIYDNGTQIGIGTTSPTGIFEVSGSSSTTNDQYFGYANGNIQGIGLSWPGTEILQTFTAGISGNLSKISVFSYGSNNNVVLKIYAGSNSQGSILYTSSPINFVNGAIVDMNIPNIVVTIGQAYTFQLQSSSNIVLAGSSGPYQVSNGTTPKSSGSSSTIVNPGYGNITSSGGIFFNTYVTSPSGSMVFENNGTVTATSFKTPFGTSSQYLMADGSVSSGSSGSTSASVDLTTNQTIAGNKTFSSDIMVNGLTIGKGIGQVNDQNITVGENTLVNNTTGQLLIAIGNGSLYSNTSANYNLGIGASTLSNNQTGENNIAIGVASLNSNTGANNTAIGRSASQLGGANSNITSLGFQAGMRNTGNSNTFLGANTDQNSPSSSITNSTALGFGAKISAANQIQLGNTSITNVNTSGSYTGSGFKTPTGTSSQYLMADGSVSSGSSSSSGVPYTGATGSVDLGTYDLKVNGLTLGIGAGAQPSNVVLGKSAMENNSTGGYSVAVGFEALKSITNGNSNTAVGYQALKSNTTGGANIAIGMNAMLNNINGSQNIAIGQSTLNNNTSASGNTVIGHSAGVNISTGGSNTIIGQEAAGGLTTGSWNTIIGRNAYTGNISNNIVLSNGQGTIKAQHDGTNWTLSGTTTATGFKTPSGTSSQYLMADGSVSSGPSVSSSASVDLTTNQTIAGAKTFSSDLNVSGLTIGGTSNTTILGANASGGPFSTTIGNNASSPSSYSVAIGRYSNAMTSYSVAIGGLNAKASESYSIAIGGNAPEATGVYSTAIGGNVPKATALQSTALGSSTTASGQNSTALGYGATVSNSNTIQLGNTAITNVNTNGTLSASGFKTPTGTSSQYLMADGSVSSVSSVSSGPQILTKAQRDALNLTSSGVMIFNTTTNQYQGSVYYTTGYNYNYFTNNIYGISEIKPGHSITQTFTGKGQVITSADIAVVNMNRPGISNTGNFTFEIWDETYQYALFSTTITLNGAGTVSVTIPNNSWYNLPTTLPNGPCSFRITSDSVTGGSADFLMNAGPSVGSLSNTYWASLGGTSNGYTTPTTSHQLAIDLFPQNGLTWVNFN